MRSSYRGNISLLLPLFAIFMSFGLTYSIQATDAQEDSLGYSNSSFSATDLDIDLVDSSSGSVSEDNDAGLFLSPEVALDHQRLKAYSADKLEGNKAHVPGLASIATHVLREQVTDTKEKSYSLADAMADALWRKQVVDSLYRSRQIDGDLQ